MSAGPVPVGGRGAGALAVRSVYQPVVELHTGCVIGYEALARGPAGPLERPDALFAEARRLGLTAELDWASRGAAFQGALERGLTPPWTLFVNVEPDVIDTPCPPALMEIVGRARRGLRAVFEITERELATKPAQLLRVVEEIRSQGWGIALDDVGADWRSLALMPLIRPDVVKLDMHLVHRPLTSKVAWIGEAVRAYAAESGAQILAEGLESPEHVQRALTLGATLGQGWMFGRPGSLPASHSERPPDRCLAVGRQPIDDATPMEAIRDLVTTTVATKADLLAITRGIERRALETSEPCVVLSAFQTAQRFTPTAARLYAELAARSAFVGAFGQGMRSEPAPRVRGASLPHNHRLLGEWDVVLVTPHYAGALVAQDLGDTGPDLERRFRMAVLTDRALVLRAARSLMLKMDSLRQDRPRAEAALSPAWAA